MKIQIKYLNGIRFKRFIINSAQRIYQMEQYLNDINVYPVADGDTGTNMVATMSSIVKGVKKCKESSFTRISSVIADSALTGARGNSGAILAQFFQGLAEATRGKVRLSTKAFANAAIQAAEQARKAISHPQEGTIITVMKDWANHLAENAHHTPDFVELFKKSLSKAKDSLAKTPDKLLILKKAGVVDAGALGFVNILEGIVNFIEYGKVKSLKVIASTTNKMRSFNLGKVDSGINFQFCAECLLEGIGLDLETIKQKVTFLGDSLIVASSKNRAHIHIHTDKPEDVFSELSELGTIVKTKVDDMHKQHTKIKLDAHTKSIGLVTDSTCDLPPELIKKYNIQIVPIVIQVGKKSYLDLAIQFAKRVKNPRFAITHVAAPELAQWYSDKIRTVFNPSKVIIAEASPALSVHIGIGGAAIAVLGDS